MTAAAAERTSGASVLAAHLEFCHLKKKIIETAGLQYYADKEQTLAERIEYRRSTLGCSPADYFSRALDPNNPEELAALIDEITVGETYFFRYPEQFDVLGRIILPDCAARHQHDRTLRIWSAGCASGAEPYSLAILLQRDLADLIRGWHVSILGTDINRKALAQARTGLFTNWELRTTAEDLKRQCFVEADKKQWLIRPEYRKGVRFEYQNLVADIDEFAAAYAGTLDMIFCRNVMIYFGPELMRKMLRAFSECLTKGGWLFVGHAEPYFEIANFFSPTTVAGVTVYRKADGSPIQRVGSGLWPRASDPTEGGISEEGIATATPARALTSFSTLDDKSIRPGELPAHAEAIKEADSIHAASSPQATVPDTQPGALAGIDLEKIRQHASTGDWSAAADACEQALRRHPLDAAVYFTYALISEHIGAVAATEQALGRAIYLDRNFALAHYHLGRFRAARGLRKAASRSLANALKIVAGHHDKEVLAMGEGLTVAELRELTRIQLDLLEER